MKKYEAPVLECQMFENDAIVATANSSIRNRKAGCYGPKNGNFGNNQNCWGTNANYMDINEYGDYCNG